MAEVYQKTADDKCIILNPREALMREMNIPADWKILDLAWGMSFTTTDGPNVDYSTTNAPGYSSVLDRTFYGVKDGSAIAPGLAGSQFIGREYPVSGEAVANSYGSYVHTHVGVSSSALSVRDGDSPRNAVEINTGASYSISNPLVGGEIDMGSLSNGSPPTGDTNYFGWRVLRINRVSPTEIQFLSVHFRNQTDASDARLRDVLLNTVWDSPIGTTNNYLRVTDSSAQGWDIRHMYFRAPFTNIRARIHNYGYRLVS